MTLLPPGRPGGAGAIGPRSGAGALASGADARGSRQRQHPHVVERVRPRGDAEAAQHVDPAEEESRHEPEEEAVGRERVAERAEGEGVVFADVDATTGNVTAETVAISERGTPAAESR